MAWPPGTFPTSRTNSTPQHDVHSQDHDSLALAINDLVPKIASMDAQLATLARVGMERSRTNIDSVGNGGSIRYTNDHGTFGVVDTGDGSGYTVPEGVYGVWFSTVPDGGTDCTCYLNVGAQSVAVGSRLAGDGASYGSWVGHVQAGQQIVVRVQMLAPRAVLGGFLTIWRLAQAT